MGEKSKTQSFSDRIRRRIYKVKLYMKIIIVAIGCAIILHINLYPFNQDYRDLVHEVRDIISEIRLIFGQLEAYQNPWRNMQIQGCMLGERLNWSHFDSTYGDRRKWNQLTREEQQRARKNQYTNAKIRPYCEKYVDKVYLGLE